MGQGYGFHAIPWFFRVVDEREEPTCDESLQGRADLGVCVVFDNRALLEGQYTDARLRWYFRHGTAMSASMATR